MEARINRALCIGKTQCISASPEAFELDQEGKAILKEGMTPVPEGLKKRVSLAARMCPVGAISIKEDGK
jgi:ferredoxin